MAAIKYTSIINSFVSQEGSAGMYTNYIYYSVLVKYVDGTSSVVEGQLREIQPLLLFLKTPQDEIEKLRSDINSLKSFIEKSDQIIINTFEKNFAYTIDSLYPIPQVVGLKEAEGLQKLSDAGLIPIEMDKSNRSINDNRVIYSCNRSKKNFRAVEVSIAYEIPEVIGMPVFDALEKIQNSGLVPTVKHTLKLDMDDGIVLSCTRKRDDSVEVELEVSKRLEMPTPRDEEQTTTESGTTNNNQQIPDMSGRNDVDPEVVKGLRYATNLVSISALRRYIKGLYQSSQSEYLKYILEQPDETIKQTGKEILAILEKSVADDRS